ncbi:4-aminobutyrate--2-oxoglutarate transaminase [Desulforhopalus sp. IMCC35007]|uniref:4-aminobutyrate--2-oxoglutarate transaminase n=1 Tax=Desulforhopalus sp. IMCC35007 TaxID=2569543 RepID=UPI0010AEDAFC|nr:4-aminobutyrate--2-oxoglutarate transaminase [Desulforhopalus sp. IMCC35007]TKB05694.1 4-aminobutyrate--2-oxoglutarate transaminase [Desulforhopalus sp. IMCC35007]
MTNPQTNAAIQERRENVLAKGFGSATSKYVAHAKGAVITDVEGNEYLDFAAGISVMNVGHSHPKVVQAIKKQAEKFTHTCFMVVPYESPVTLAEKLCKAVPGDSKKAVMFVNSGVESIENAVKIARYYTKKKGIIAFEGAFHGRTLLGMSLTSKVKPYKYGLGPFAPEVYRMPYANCYRCPFGQEYPGCDLACADHLEEILISHVCAEDTAAIIFEPVQGEGGFIAPPKEYFQRLKKICEKNSILMIADEIQTGMGRTGYMFAMDYYGVEVDITTVAKSLGAGMPISAVVGKKEIMDSVHLGGIGGTYSANPIACEAALAVFDIFESENLLAKAKVLGEKLQFNVKALQEKHALIGDVRGIGPMIAFELVNDRETKTPAPDKVKQLVQFCLERNLFILACGTYKNVIRLLMPLVISEEEMTRGMDIIDRGLAAIS